MEIIGLAVMVAGIAALVLYAILSGEEKENSQGGKASSTRRVFDRRTGWRRLPDNLLSALADRLASPQEAKTFINIIEESGIYEAKLRHAIDASTVDTTFSLQMLTIQLTSYGNGCGDRGNIWAAKKCFHLALRLTPGYVPAQGSMAMTEMLSGNPEEAVHWADKVLGEEQSHDHEPLQEQMRAIKKACVAREKSE